MKDQRREKVNILVTHPLEWRAEDFQRKLQGYHRAGDVDMLTKIDKPIGLLRSKYDILFLNHDTEGKGVVEWESREYIRVGKIVIIWHGSFSQAIDSYLDVVYLGNKVYENRWNDPDELYEVLDRVIRWF